MFKFISGGGAMDTGADTETQVTMTTSMFRVPQCWCASDSTSQIKGFMHGGKASVDIPPA